MIELDGLRKTFVTHRGEELEAVSGVSLRIAKGEIYGLLGPNGAGKTTVMRMLTGLMAPSAGRIVLDGRVAVDVSRHINDPLWLKQRIGFLAEGSGLYERLSPRENLMYFGALRDLPCDACARQVSELIGILGIADYADRRCEGLSTGQRQRVQIARTLVGDPPVLILDEPTLGLDVLTNQLILDFIRATGRAGRTIVLSTHSLDEVEDICARFGMIHRGQLLAEGTLAELRAKSGRERLSDVFRTLVEQVDPDALPRLTWPAAAPGGAA